MKFKESPSGLLVPDHKIVAAGKYHAKHIRQGEVIDEWDCDNLVVNQGLNYLLSAGLGAGSQISSWYLGLFQANYTPVAGDTAATFPGSATETTGYTAGARQGFTAGAVSGQSITNSASAASFTFNATLTIYGAFLASSSVISGTTGTLFSAAQFGTAKSVVSSDVLLLTYSFAAASS